MEKYRNYSIDLLRGLAIFGMVLAAVIPWTAEFPAWMYHAQVGPPDFKFNPSNPGITWVDLVFPFFLFSMGAAFPFALRNKLANDQIKEIVIGIGRRGSLLVFFAIALAYLTPDNLTSTPVINYLSSLITFFCFFLVFMKFEGAVFKRYGLQILGFAIIAVLVYYHSEIVGNTFSKSKSNIIILVLANMAVFGSIAWLLTASNIYLRLAILIAFMGVYFTKDIPGWTQDLWRFDPAFHWFYNFSFLKYLCIVLPGSILGDLVVSNKLVTNKFYDKQEQKSALVLAVLAIMFVLFHVITLYTRTMYINLLGHIAFVILFVNFFKKNRSPQIDFYYTLCGWGLTLVTLGLFFEPWDGGIKKDPSSFSYWFLTSGLAFVFYCALDYLTKLFPKNILISSLVKCGQNPMIAYCVTSFFITPVLGLIYVLPVLKSWGNQSPYLGLISTGVFMILMVVLTNIATNRKWFWRS